MGIVYRAVQERLGREVAVKVLRADMTRDGERLKRFEREVAACIRLAHPNIVKILDSGELDGKHYYVMELLTDGRTVEEALRDGPLPPARAAEVAAQLLDALAYCHAQLILHRDVKPGNVMLRPGGMVTLMDFGLVKDLDASTLLTRVGQSVGTPRYMAPEMFTSEEPTPRVDLWATGCLLYESLTTRAPFDGATLLEVATRISICEYRPATHVMPSLPASTDALIAKFLNADFKRRIATAEEAAEAVRDWAASLEAGAPEAAPAIPSPPPTPRGTKRPTHTFAANTTATADPVPTDARGASRRRLQRLVAVMAGAAACGLVLGLALRPLRQRAMGPDAVPAAAARAVGELAIVEGASTLEVTFDSTLGTGQRLEGEARIAGPPLRVQAAVQPASTAGRRGVLAGLPPGTRVRVRVLAPDGAELAAQDASTRSLPPVAAELAAALAELAPFTTGQEMVHEVERALRIKDEPDREKKVEQVRRRWEQRLREVYSHQRLEALITDLTPLAERLMTSPDVPAEVRRQLHEQLYNLAELEDVAAHSQIPLPALAARLDTRAYGSSPAPTLVAPHAVGWRLSDDAPLPADVLKPAGEMPVTRMGGEHVIIYSDLRRAADMFVSTFGEGVVTLPGPVALPPPEQVRAVELTVSVIRCNPANGIRVMVSSNPSNRREDWRTIAVLRATTKERCTISHLVPAGLLSGRPLYVRLELAYSPARFVFENVVEQELWLKWFAFAWDGDAAPVGTASPAH